MNYRGSFILGIRPFLILLAIFMILVVGIGIFLKICEDEKALNDWGTFLTGAGTMGLVGAALYAAIAALQEYRERSRGAERKRILQKAQWLTQLFQRFYEGDTYKDIRRKFDYDEMEALLALIRKDKDPKSTFGSDEQVLFDRFTDFLNFFEFVAYLKELKQLDTDDIKAMFEYYFERIVEVDQTGEIREYLSRSGFGNLQRMLTP